MGLGAALDYVAERLAGEILDWWVIGSAALDLHGIDGVDVQDIDILVPDVEQARLAANLLGAEKIKTSPSDLFRSEYFAKCVQSGIEIEIMAGFQIRDRDGWHQVKPETRVAFSRETGLIYAPELDELCGIFGRFGRDKDLARIALVIRQISDGKAV